MRDRLGTGIAFLEGRCHEFAQTTAYGVVVQHLRGYLGFHEDDPKEVGRVQLAAALHQVFGSSPPQVHPALEHLLGLDTARGFEASVHESGPEEVRSRVVEAILAFWERVAAKRPTLLMIEDLQWMDSASSAVLEEMLPITERAPLMLLCTFRPERRSPAWEFKVAAERDYPHCYHEVRLQPLSEKHTERLAELLLEGLGLPVELNRRVAHRAEGNPFYVEEVVRSLLEQGPATTAIPRLPDTLQEVLQARLSGLPPKTRRVLQAASVIGRTFPLSLLASVCKINGELASHLSVLQRTDFIREQQRLPDPRFSFKHVLLQEATYQTLLREERCGLHRRVAELLEQEPVDPLNLPVLVHHLVQGEDWHAAFVAAIKAGDAAQSLAALEAALEQYDIALKIAADHPESVFDPVMLLHLQEERGAVLGFLSRYEEAEAHFEQLLRHHERAKVMARFYRNIGRLNSLSGDLRKAEGNLNRALRLLATDPDPIAEVDTLRDLAHIMERRRAFAKALDYAQRSLAVAVRHALRPQVRDIYHVLAIAHLFGGDLAEAARYATESLSLALEDTDQLGIVRSHNDLAQVLLFTGRIEQARQEAEEAQALATKLNIRMPLAQIQHTLAEIHLEQGKWEEAAGVLRSVEDAIRRHSLGAALEALVHREQGFVALAQGQCDEAVRRLETARALEQGTGITRHLPKIHRGLAEAYLGLGDFTRAQGNAIRAKGYERRGNPFETPGALRVLAVVAREKGEKKRALALLTQSRALLETRKRTAEYCKVLFELAATLAGAGRMSEAQDMADESLHICMTIEAPSLIASARRLVVQLSGEH